MIHHLRQLGFTLIEMMLTVLVLGVLVSVAAPSFEGIRERIRIKAAAEAVYSHLQFVRSESIKQNRRLHVRVMLSDELEGAGWCLGVSNSADCDCSATESSCRYGSSSSLVERNLSSADFPGIEVDANLADLEFDGVRGLSASAGTITVSGAQGLAIQVVQSRLGRVRLCSDSSLGYPSCS